MNRVPPSPLAIDARWLQAALGEMHPGVRVRDVALLERHAATNDHARLRVEYEEDDGAPDTLFCKMLPEEPMRRGAIAATGMGPVEVGFYTHLAPHVGLRSPHVHVALCDGDDFILLMEDLEATGSRVFQGPTGVTPDSAAGALRDLAEMHARYADPARRRREAPWLSEPAPPSDYGTGRLAFALEHHRERLSGAFSAACEAYVANAPALHALWHDPPHSVLHGDAHLGNLFDDQGRTGFLDWGLATVSTPLRDACYFIQMALDVEDRRTHERDLLRHYLDVSGALGAFRYAWDDAWRAHRTHAAYLAPACCQIVTFPEGISEARQVFSEAFLARAEAAISDLEVPSLLKDRGVT